MMEGSLILIKLISFICLLYAIYCLVVQEIMLQKKYIKNNVFFRLESEYNNEELMNLLVKKNFYYPDIKRLTFNKEGKVVVECKYASHVLNIDGDVVQIDRGNGLLINRSRLIKEAEIIKSYILKSLNPLFYVKADEKYKGFKNTKYKKLVSGVMALVSIVCFIYY